MVSFSVVTEGVAIRRLVDDGDAVLHHGKIDLGDADIPQG
jgi:hypothetical protein